MRTRFSFSISTLAMASLALAGCHHRAVPKGTAVARGMTVAQARLILPIVKGNPGVAYFTLGNDTGLPATLVRVDIVGARSTEMHETLGGTMAPLPQLRIAPGQRAVFAPGGRHVMAFGIAPGLTPGGTSAISFHFQDGKVASAPLRIESGVGGMSGMAGMPGMAGMAQATGTATHAKP